jgi:2-iminoacetate synthase ThiH
VQQPILSQARLDEIEAEVVAGERLNRADGEDLYTTDDLLDDLDGLVVEYKIIRDADGFGTPNKMTREDLLDLIREAGFRPLERGTRYETLREYDGSDATRGTVPRDHAGLPLTVARGPRR